MKKIILSILALSALAMASCSSDATANDASKGAEDANKGANIESISGTGTASNVTATVNGDASQQQQQQVPAAKPGENPYAKLTGMNPEHGQPGHRCDIQVGEPLNTPPRDMNAAAQQPVQVQPATSQAPAINVNPAGQPQAPAQVTAPGFKGKPNPAHGQPGHRCDVKEGEILP